MIVLCYILVGLCLLGGILCILTSPIVAIGCLLSAFTFAIVGRILTYMRDTLTAAESIRQDVTDILNALQKEETTVEKI